jgi:beta-galactosidase/beta-glucuronidase
LARHDVPLRSAEFEERLSSPIPTRGPPKTPNLYDLAVELEHDGRVVDAAERTIGFRRFEARDGRPLLNGEPFARATAMGLNTLRCHVKIPDRLYFDLADRLGLIVWLDMPYMQFLVPATREALWRVFRTSVGTHGHHPSLSTWTLFNEGWGIDLADNQTTGVG